MSYSEPYYMRIRSGPVVVMTGVLIIMAALILVAGCTNATPSTPPPTPVYTPQTTILIGSAGVNPQILVVDRGVTVTFLNLDMGLHIVTSDPGIPMRLPLPSFRTTTGTTSRLPYRERTAITARITRK